MDQLVQYKLVFDINKTFQIVQIPENHDGLIFEYLPDHGVALIKTQHPKDFVHYLSYEFYVVSVRNILEVKKKQDLSKMKFFASFMHKETKMERRIYWRGYPAWIVKKSSIEHRKRSTKLSNIKEKFDKLKADAEFKRLKSEEKDEK